MTSKILKLALAFSWSLFPTGPKMSEEKFKYLKNEKRFQHEIKSILYDFERLSLKQIKPTFLERETPTSKVRKAKPRN